MIKRGMNAVSDSPGSTGAFFSPAPPRAYFQLFQAFSTAFGYSGRPRLPL